MKVTQTIQLDDNEKEILEQAFSLIDKMAYETKVEMDDVYDHLVEYANLSGPHGYVLNNLIDISDL